MFTGFLLLLIIGGIVFWKLQASRQEFALMLNQESRQTNPNEPPLLLKGIGVTLAEYDPATNKAGDFVFTKQKLQFDRIWMDYGFSIPSSSAGAAKRNPQPTFILPLGTKVRSLVDGIVVDIPKLYSGDYSVMVAPDIKSNWRYETEHVINPTVKVGDRVTAGQIVAEVSDYDSKYTPGFGLVEIGILKGGNPPQHLCPFQYLDPFIKDSTQRNIQAFYQAWEKYRNQSNLYDETIEPIGCLTTEAIDG
ncbi:MAG: M23 family metallopeptidase [bacterium]|nr:M23 family metallopeptidase [bacterium]